MMDSTRNCPNCSIRLYCVSFLLFHFLLLKRGTETRTEIRLVTTHVTKFGVIDMEWNNYLKQLSSADNLFNETVLAETPECFSYTNNQDSLIGDISCVA